jgi:hypothetical protein
VSCYGEDPNRHIRVVGRELRTQLRITIQRIDLEDNSNSGGCGLYTFRFPRYARDDLAATRLAEAFVYGMSLVHGPVVEAHPDGLVLRVPDRIVRKGFPVRLDDLVTLEKSRPIEDHTLTYPLSTIGSISCTTPERHEAAWRLAVLTFCDPVLFDATRFLKRSYDNFYVFPGQLYEVLSEPEAVACNSSQQADFEEALHNAFKAIEAVVGDPPKDDRRFFHKLEAIGIDPLEEVGYGEKVALAVLIRRMNVARDKRSAHGSTRHRTIRVVELLDFQACAEAVVLAALEKAKSAALVP